MKDHLHVDYAMEMDQGGSSTMYVKGHGIVSNPGSGPRDIYSSLWLIEK